MPVLTHVAMHVRDLQSCVAFYRDYCGLRVCHQRDYESGPVVWMAEPGREQEFILVLIPNGPGRVQAAKDYSHLGFAMQSREEVDAVAERARVQGLLLWEPREEPFPVGYYCGVRDPDGTAVEFSYGQPLGPGAEGYSLSDA